jgi:pheromone a factor receptor
LKTTRTREERHGFVLPMQCVLSFHFSKLAVYSNLFLSKNKRKPRLFSSQLKSGWDDMLDVKVPKAKINLSIRLSTCSSPVSEDEQFKTSTLSYLGSPTAKTLGLSGSPVPQNVSETPKSRTSSPVSPAVQRAADNPVSAPPNVPLPSRPESCYGSHSRSRSPSNLFLDETIGTLTPLLSLFPSI